jgi:hypothetical protein
MSRSWVTRKLNTVRRFEKSSFLVGRQLALKERTLSSTFSIPETEYIDHGGAIPIRIKVCYSSFCPSLLLPPCHSHYPPSSCCSQCTRLLTTVFSLLILTSGLSIPYRSSHRLRTAPGRRPRARGKKHRGVPHDPGSDRSFGMNSSCFYYTMKSSVTGR